MLACPFKNKLMRPISAYRLREKPAAKLTSEQATRHLNIWKIDGVTFKIKSDHSLRKKQRFKESSFHLSMLNVLQGPP